MTEKYLPSEWDRYPAGIGDDEKKIIDDAGSKAVRAAETLHLPMNRLQLVVRRFGTKVFWRIQPKE